MRGIISFITGDSHGYVHLAVIDMIWWIASLIEAGLHS